MLDLVINKSYFFMKKNLIIILLVFVVFSCRDNNLEVDLSKSDKVILAMSEIMSVYSQSGSAGWSYEETVEKVKMVCEKYKVRVEPISREDFLSHVSLLSNAKDAGGCNGPFYWETVSEGNGCFGWVWHYNNGSTGFQRHCQDVNGIYHPAGPWECTYVSSSSE